MRGAYILVSAALIAGAGCASQPPRETTDELARAQALIGEAEQSNAQQYAAADLQEARDRLREANAESAKRPIEARRLASEAALDAQLASARAADGKAQRAVHDAQESLDTLRSEENRNLDQRSGPVAPSAEPSAPPPPPAPAPSLAPGTSSSQGPG